MIKNDEMINIYNDYDSTIYAPSVDPRGNDLVFPPKTDDGEPYLVFVPFNEVRNIHRLDKTVFTKRKLRIEEDMEAEVFKQLNINIDREIEVFSREEIEDMIINPTNYTIETILSITNKSVIDTFLSQLVYLKNTNKYFIADKVENYIRARKEELEQGIRRSELEGQPTENIPTIVEEVDTAVVEEVVVEVEKPKAKPKAKSTGAKTTTKAKK